MEFECMCGCDCCSVSVTEETVVEVVNPDTDDMNAALDALEETDGDVTLSVAFELDFSQEDTVGEAIVKNKMKDLLMDFAEAWTELAEDLLEA